MNRRLGVRLTKNFLAGLMFIGFGLLGLWLSVPLDNGTLSDMGPGYFPRDFGSDGVARCGSFGDGPNAGRRGR
jgi:hypothetical protein